MNRKGMTLMEVLVSLVLISIVMIFIVNLLSDLKNEGIISNNRNEDALTRASLINVIEGDLINSSNGLIEFAKKCNQSDDINNQECYQFKFKDGTIKNLYVTEAFIAYGPTNAMEKWNINYGTYDLKNIKINYVSNSNNGVLSPSLLTIHIPVTGVDANAKNKFDIELTALSTGGTFNCSGC